jgi:hypothetical protein
LGGNEMKFPRLHMPRYLRGSLRAQWDACWKACKN